MDSSLNPKNKMHLAWRLYLHIYTHWTLSPLYTGHLSDTAGRSRVCGNMRGSETKGGGNLLICFFFHVCGALMDIEDVLLKNTFDNPTLKAKHEMSRRDVRTKAGEMLDRAFSYQLMMRHGWRHWNKTVRSLNQPWFFLFYSSATRVQRWLQVQRCACCIVSMQFVFPFLVFFVLLLTGTFNTKPLLIFRRSCMDPDTRPGGTQRKTDFNKSLTALV